MLSASHIRLHIQYKRKWYKSVYEPIYESVRGRVQPCMKVWLWTSDRPGTKVRQCTRVHLCMRDRPCTRVCPCTRVHQCMRVCQCKRVRLCTRTVTYESVRVRVHSVYEFVLVRICLCTIPVLLRVHECTSLTVYAPFHVRVHVWVYEQVWVSFVYICILKTNWFVSFIY